jgi:hypothetical protein
MGNGASNRMNKLERYYVAGLLEGEGCFSVAKGKPRKDGSRRITARIQVFMADKDIIERLCEYTGKGKVLGPYYLTKNTKIPERYTPSNHAGVYKWDVVRDDAIIISKEVYPLLGERRRAQIDAAFSLLSS